MKQLSEILCAAGFHFWEEEPRPENIGPIKWKTCLEPWVLGEQTGLVCCKHPGCLAQKEVKRIKVVTLFGEGIFESWEICESQKNNKSQSA